MSKEKWKLTPAAFRKGVNWLLFVAIFHFAGNIIYGAFFGNSAMILFDKDENYAKAYTLVLTFQLLFWLLVALIFIWRWQMSYSEVQREMKNAAKEEGFNPNRYFYNAFFKGWIWRTILYAVFQIPFLIFYAAFGLNLGNGMIGLERFYIASAGFYGVSGSFILGILLGTAYFFAIMVAVHYVTYRVMLCRQNKF